MGLHSFQPLAKNAGAIRKVRELAEEADAIYKVDSVVLVNIELFGLPQLCAGGVKHLHESLQEFVWA